MPEWAADLLRLATFGVLLWLIWYSRRWEAPKVDAELRAVEDDIRVLRGNVARVERDMFQLRKEFVDVNGQILREVRSLSENGAREAPLEERIQDVQDAVFELERTIAAMPCAMHVQNNMTAVPKPEPKE